MLCVSLVLTTFNSKNNFIKTYESIQKQTYTCIEIIIIDGASTDGTKEEIQLRAEENPNVNWISEPDKGIFDAMNKGLHLAKGDIIAFFNDEFLVEDAVEQYVESIQNNNCDGVHSDLVYTDEYGKVIRYWRMGKGEIKKGWLPGHPTLYLKRTVYERYGNYKAEYHCAADYKFIIRILKDGEINLEYIPKMLVSMYYGGTSSSGVKAYWVSFYEGVRALRKNGVNCALWINILRMLRVLMQFRLSKNGENWI